MWREFWTDLASLWCIFNAFKRNVICKYIIKNMCNKWRIQGVLSPVPSQGGGVRFPIPPKEITFS